MMFVDYRLLLVFNASFRYLQSNTNQTFYHIDLFTYFLLHDENSDEPVWLI